ncbi:MAG: hypothetical protein HY294_07775 [Candidatus Rokubacteria bacterium]|nr:hypothetical protein [Candidatus Rokubacteria bacterium]
MRQRQQALDRVNEEIAREKAASLGRAGERLEDALAEVAALAARVGAAADAAERARLVAQHEAARVRAAQRRLALIIQREAMGLRSHRVLDQQFPEPRRLAGEAGA